MDNDDWTGNSDWRETRAGRPDKINRLMEQAESTGMAEICLEFDPEAPIPSDLLEEFGQTGEEQETRWYEVEDLDESHIEAALWGLYAELEEGDHNIFIDLPHVDHIPEIAIADLEAGGEPLIKIQINTEKLRELQAKFEANQSSSTTAHKPTDELN